VFDSQQLKHNPKYQEYARAVHLALDWHTKSPFDGNGVESRLDGPTVIEKRLGKVAQKARLDRDILEGWWSDAQNVPTPQQVYQIDLALRDNLPQDLVAILKRHALKI
jgi:hypothetical protein